MLSISSRKVQDYGSSFRYHKATDLTMISLYPEIVAVGIRAHPLELTFQSADAKSNSATNGCTFNLPGFPNVLQPGEHQKRDQLEDHERLGDPPVLRLSIWPFSSPWIVEFGTT